MKMRQLTHQMIMRNYLSGIKMRLTCLRKTKPNQAILPPLLPKNMRNALQNDKHDRCQNPSRNIFHKLPIPMNHCSSQT